MTTASTDPVQDSTIKAETHGTHLQVIQAYALSLERQPLVDFGSGGIPGLDATTAQINGYLTAAKSNASIFLNRTVPDAVMVLADVKELAQTYEALTAAVTPATPLADVKNILAYFREVVSGYQQRAASVNEAMAKARETFSTDAANMTSGVNALNAAIGGSEGILKSIDDQVDKLNSEINAAIGGLVASVIGIIGGAIMIAVGAVGSVVTGGAATALIVAGVAVAAAGVGGTVGSSLAISKGNEQKNALIMQKATINTQLQTALKLKDGLGAIGMQAANAATATQGMVSAWTVLGNYLDSAIKASDPETANQILTKIFVSTKLKSLKESAIGCLNQLQGPGPSVYPGKPVEQVQTELLKEAHPEAFQTS
ncbi:HBL/NHE enterotoxin family protein [Streptomyces sp. NPDC048362]|uniref:HBL/NHE enterotoxin family protein n=1 Tax=Streptomyces sp. NPDC048362 TaxID=3365539 RepID=UPI0037202DF0